MVTVIAPTEMSKMATIGVMRTMEGKPWNIHPRMCQTPRKAKTSEY